MQAEFSREHIAHIDREQRLLQIARRIDRELGRAERETLPPCKDDSTTLLASQKWNENHSQQYLEYQRCWAKAHAERRKEYQRRWRENHPGQTKEYFRRWAKAHAEQRKEYQRCRRENHPRRVVKESFLCELEKMADKVE